MKIGGLFIAAAMVLVLAGCSNDPQPRDPATTATPTSTSTSTATPPLRPPQADEDSPEGAAAFVSYWVEVSNYAAATGDVDELSRISDPDCSGCQSYIDLYRDTYEAGGYFKGGGWELGELALRVNDVEVLATTDVELSKSRFKRSSEDDEGEGAAEKTQITLGVSPKPEDRVLTQLFLGQPE